MTLPLGAFDKRVGLYAVGSNGYVIGTTSQTGNVIK